MVLLQKIKQTKTGERLQTRKKLKLMAILCNYYQLKNKTCLYYPQYPVQMENIVLQGEGEKHDVTLSYRKHYNLSHLVNAINRNSVILNALFCLNPFLELDK